MVAFVLSIILCVCSMSHVLTKWQTNPIILIFDGKSQSVGNIPFPAVTICSVVKTATNIFNYTDVYRARLRLDGNNSRYITEDEYEFINLIVND